MGAVRGRRGQLGDRGPSVRGVVEDEIPDVRRKPIPTHHRRHQHGFLGRTGLVRLVEVGAMGDLVAGVPECVDEWLVRLIFVPIIKRDDPVKTFCKWCEAARLVVGVCLVIPIESSAQGGFNEFSPLVAAIG